MNLPELSVKRPVLAGVMAMLICVAGLAAFTTLPLRQLPDIDPSIVTVQTTYRGASAEVTESRVTEVIENQLSGLQGIDEIASTSRDGRSNITITFNLGRNVDEAANDVRDAVARVVGSLPPEVDAPEIAKADLDSQPIMFLNVSSKSLDSLALYDYVDRYIVDRLATIDGVAQARIFGAPRYAMRIWLDRNAMAARSVTAEDIEQALRAQNVEAPAGGLEASEKDFSVRVARDYATPEDFAKLPIRVGGQDYVVRLGDVAHVEEGADERRRYFRGNGTPQLGLGIIRQSQANDIDISKKLHEEIATISQNLPAGTEIAVAFDSTVFTARAVEEVWVTLAIAILLVALVNYLFLGSLRAAIIPSIVAPLCVLGSFLFLAVFGFSINILTLLALVLSIGLVVDDAIVVVENIQRRVDLGEPANVAALRGSRQVYFAVIATTLVLLAVFAPLLFLPGFVGRLFVELGVAIGGAVLVSAFLALSLSPMMASKLLVKAEHMGPVGRAVQAGVAASQRSYEASLHLILKRPWAMGAVILIVAGAAYGLLKLTPAELTPQEDQGRVDVNVSAPEGVGFDGMTRIMSGIEQTLMAELGKGEVTRLITVAPNFGDGRFSTGRAVVVLADWKKRKRSASEIAASLQAKLSNVTAARVVVSARSGFQRGAAGGREISVVLQGANLAEIAKRVEPVLAAARQDGRFSRVRTNYEPNSPRYVVTIDRERAASSGISVDQVGRTLETMFGSRRVTTYLRNGLEYDVLMQADLESRRSADDLSDVYLRARNGELTPLASLVSLRLEGDNADRRRLNRLSALTLTANFDQGTTIDDATQFFSRELKAKAPEIVYRWTGEAKDRQEAGSAILVAFLVALLVVFLVLAAQFESLIHPAIIMMTVPLAIGGGLFGLYVTGQSLNIYSQIGLIILVGIAAKNGILIVEFANQLRDQGKSVAEAAIDASSLRLRPIVMTSMTAAIGALPLVFGHGAGSEARVAIGITIFFGVVFATLLTLFVIPVLYAAFARFTRSPEWTAKQIDAYEAQEKLAQTSAAE